MKILTASARVLALIVSFLGAVEVSYASPKVVTDLCPEMFHSWTSSNASGVINDDKGYSLYNLNASTPHVYGNSSVVSTLFADLSEYSLLEIVATEGAPRLLFNRDFDDTTDPDHLIAIPDYQEQTDAYQTMVENEDGTRTYTINLARIVSDRGYAHLHAIKGAYWTNVVVSSIKLIQYDANDFPQVVRHLSGDQANGQVVVCDLSERMFHMWTSSYADAKISDEKGYAAKNYNIPTSLVYGNSMVQPELYADLSEYSSMMIIASEGAPRVLLNRDIEDNMEPEHLIQIPTNEEQTARYQTIVDNEDGTNTYIIDLAKVVEDRGYAHLHAIKGAHWVNVVVNEIKLTRKVEK